MEFKKTYFFAHLFITILAFVAFLLVVIGLLEPDQISKSALSMMIASSMLVVLSIYQYKRDEVDRISVFYSISILAMLIILSVVISIGQ